MDKVSIIIPSFNRRELVAEAVRSCLSQDYDALEVIVIDDGSTDETGPALESMAREDARMTWHRQENAGQCAARNAGFRRARGRWIKFLDSDDVLAPGAIEAQVALLQQHNAGFIAGTGLGHDEGQLEPLRERWARDLAGEPDRIECVSLRSFIMHHEGTLNEALLQRELVERAGGFSEKLHAAEEINFLWHLYFAQPDLEVIRHSRCVYFKRYSLSSLAAVMRQQQAVPWALVSTADTVQTLFDRKAALDDELKRHLFDQLYRCIALACRKGQDSFVEPALLLWRRGQLPPPRLIPWYHDWLHRIFGLQSAERMLGKMRRWVRGNNQTPHR